MDGSAAMALAANATLAACTKPAVIKITAKQAAVILAKRDAFIHMHNPFASVTGNRSRPFGLPSPRGLEHKKRLYSPRKKQLHFHKNVSHKIGVLHAMCPPIA
jgi:hypothetical protein